jgi:hypothetical protein
MDCALRHSYSQAPQIFVLPLGGETKFLTHTKQHANLQFFLNVYVFRHAIERQETEMNNRKRLQNLMFFISSSLTMLNYVSHQRFFLR